MAAETQDREGARAAYERIVLMVQPLLVNRALRLTRDRDEASDLVQATLERGYRSFGQFEPGTNAASWLCAIMTNHFIDGLRREKPVRYTASIDKLEIAAPVPEKPPIWAGLAEEEVREATECLPEYCRRPFELHTFGQLSYREIATRLRLPMNTVCTRIYRARRRLKRLLLAKLAN
jgi:RNA polymerase sigma-70 factor (ECF subfamily)